MGLKNPEKPQPGGSARPDNQPRVEDLDPYAEQAQEEYIGAGVHRDEDEEAGPPNTKRSATRERDDAGLEGAPRRRLKRP